jgi:Site-specific recombinase XerD
MQSLKEYLQQKNYRPLTVEAHLKNVSYFTEWIKQSGLQEIENTTYNDLLSYVQYEQKRNVDVATINLRLGSISKYFDFLKQQDESIIYNPARNLRIKGKAKTVVEQPLKYEELEGLYNAYKALQKQSLHQIKTDLAHKRNIVIVGLLVWQGLHSGELQKLEVDHINLQEGIIYVPSTARSNSRELRLTTQQILSLHHYIHEVREKLCPKENELFPGDLHNIVNLLTEELKAINPKIKNALHIRGSVILHWLRQHSKRQVQYLCGHKHIDSTERYKVQEMETLINQLSKHHPFS